MSKQAQTDSKPNRILIVEDEIPLLTVIGTKLEKSGFETVTARTMKQAFEYLVTVDKIDVIWLDHYLLGKETGLDLISAMKQDKRFDTIPIFVVTNSGTPDKRHKYLHLGAQRYYIKAEMRLDEIIADIYECLRGKHKV